MNKAVFLLFCLFVTVLCSPSDGRSKNWTSGRLKNSSQGLPVSASNADIDQIYNRGFEKNSESDQTYNRSSSSSVSVGSETNAPNSTTKTPSPILVMSRNSPDQTLSFIREQIEKKYCQQYSIKSDDLKPSNYKEIESLIDSLSPHLVMLVGNPVFERASYQKLYNVVYELNKFDTLKRFWLGSMIVDPKNEDILKIEYEKIFESREKTGYSLVHGSVSRLEQRQQYLQQREEFLETLL